MAIVHMSGPSGSGFFVFPLDGSTPASRAAQDLTRVVVLPAIEPLLSAATANLLRPRVGTSRLQIVGLAPEEAVEKKWDLVVGGETVLFVEERRIVAYATIIHAERSHAIAERVFGMTAAGRELLLFLVEVTPCDYDLARFNRAAGRAERSGFRSFTTLPAAAVRRLEDNFGSIWSFLESAATRPAPPAAGSAESPA